MYFFFFFFFCISSSFKPELVMSSEEFFSDTYKMSYPNRGKAIIINNRVFDRKLNLGERTGTDVDAIALHQRFSEMGFEAEVIDNQTVKDMAQILYKGEFMVNPCKTSNKMACI